MSGAYDTDTTCYDTTGEECCDDYWCDAVYACLHGPVDCCEASGYSYVGEGSYDDKYCCPPGSTDYSYGVPGENDIVGCCYFDPLSHEPSDCCRPPMGTEKSVTYNPTTGTCEITEYEPCPCEGCCDFNCCDELDYFLHKAFYEYYQGPYAGNFNAFYDDMY